MSFSLAINTQIGFCQKAVHKVTCKRFLSFAVVAFYFYSYLTEGVYVYEAIHIIHIYLGT